MSSLINEFKWVIQCDVWNKYMKKKKFRSTVPEWRADSATRRRRVFNYHVYNRFGKSISDGARGQGKLWTVSVELHGEKCEKKIYRGTYIILNIIIYTSTHCIMVYINIMYYNVYELFIRIIPLPIRCIDNERFKVPSQLQSIPTSYFVVVLSVHHCSGLQRI